MFSPSKTNVRVTPLRYIMQITEFFQAISIIHEIHMNLEQ